MPGFNFLSKTKPFRHYLTSHKRTFALGVLALLLTNTFDVLTPIALKGGIDALEAHDPNALFKAVMIYALIMAGVTACRYQWRVNFGRFQHRIAEDLQNLIYAKLTELGASFYNRTPVGQVISLISQDVNAFRMAVGPGFLLLFDALFYTAMILPLMMHLSPDWTWKTLIIIPVVPFLIRRMEILIHARSRTQQDILAKVSAKATEIIAGIRPIKSFAQEKNQTLAFDEFSRRWELAANSLAKADSAFHPAMQLPVTLGSVLLLWLCSGDVVRGTISLGTFFAFHEYIKRMVWPMTAIGMGISLIEQGRASYDRIADLLDTPTDVPDTGDSFVGKFRRLDVRDLSFRYPGAGHDALRNVSLSLAAGETLGLVGPVGAGKSTLVNLLCRVYPAPRGTIAINGTDLADLKRESLSATVALVPQEAFLFSDTISENVALGLSHAPTLAEIQEATESANIDHEINCLPEGYDTLLGERGVNLSGGQKQRLTIARALIRRPPVMIFDDSLSAVDARTESAIVEAIRKERERNPELAAIIISHRLAPLKNVDRIAVLAHGSLEAIGTHDELLAESPTYRRLYDLQSQTPSQAQETLP